MNVLKTDNMKENILYISMKLRKEYIHMCMHISVDITFYKLKTNLVSCIKFERLLKSTYYYGNLDTYII